MADLVLTINKSLPIQVEKVVLFGHEIPWDITEVEVHWDMYNGRSVKIYYNGGEMYAWIDTVDCIDNTPPAPTCDCCGQEIKNERRV